MTNITQTIQKLVVIYSLLSSATLFAKEVSGINIPENATLSENTQLQLNGAGIRSKFFFDIYIGALYVESKSNSAKTLISNPGANRMLMHLLYDKLAKEKITSGWTNGFKENNTEQQFQKLKSSLEKFNALFTDVNKGDVILLDYIPQTGTEVKINKKLLGTIPGDEFNKSLRKVWLGDEPADSDLKDALLNR